MSEGRQSLSRFGLTPQTSIGQTKLFEPLPDPLMASPFWREQLRKILDAPIGMLPDQPRPLFWIDPLDRALATMIAEDINARNSAAVLAPHITGVGLALIARALAV